MYDVTQVRRDCVTGALGMAQQKTPNVRSTALPTLLSPRRLPAAIAGRPQLGKLNKAQLIREIKLHGSFAHRNIVELWCSFQAGGGRLGMGRRAPQAGTRRGVGTRGSSAASCLTPAGNLSRRTCREHQSRSHHLGLLYTMILPLPRRAHPQEGNQVALVQRYCQQGDLLRLLQKCGGRMNEKAAVQVRMVFAWLIVRVLAAASVLCQ